MPRSFTEDFKKMIVDLYKSGKSVTELAREYGISQTVIYKWVGLKETVKVEDETVTKEEIIALRKKVAELEEENDILKKATAIFAKKK